MFRSCIKYKHIIVKPIHLPLCSKFEIIDMYQVFKSSKFKFNINIKCKYLIKKINFTFQVERQLCFFFSFIQHYNSISKCIILTLKISSGSS